MELKEQSDWYKIPVSTVREYGGAGLLHYYNFSISKALQVVYPGNSTFLDKSSRVQMEP